MRWIGVVFGVLFPLTSARAADSLTEFPRLDSAGAPRPPPFLFVNAQDIARAKENSRLPALQPVRERLRADAAKALETKLDPFPTDWWPKIKAKPWEQTYPEIFLHTNVEPVKIALPLDALWRHYAITGEAQCLEKARAILLHLATFSFEPEHYDVGLNYSVWCFRALQAYDALFERLTPAERRTLDDFFTRFGAAVLKNDLFWIANDIGGGINNHLAWHKTLIGLLGLFYGRPELVEFGLHSRRGLCELLEVGLVDDGLWCESSLVYHFTAIAPMMLFADALRRAGHTEDLASMTLADGRTLRQPMDVMPDTLFPDGTVPPVGDAYGNRPHLAKIGPYELAWRFWQAPVYAWLIAHGPERTAAALFAPMPPADAAAPPIASRLFPEHGYAFLRTHRDAAYWGTDARCAFLTFDRAGVHCNADKLGLMYFGFGKLLLADVEGKATVPHAFSSRIQRELNRCALSQNTVMIDLQDQRPPGRVLDLIEFRDLPAEKRVTAADRNGTLYPGVRQQRTLCLTDDYLLDVFQVACDSPRQIDWITHVLDDRAKRVAGPTSEPIAPPASDGAWPWLRSFRQARADDAWHMAWESGGVRLRLAMTSVPGTQLVECDYPADDTMADRSSPMLLVRRRAAETTFAAVYTAGRGQAAGAIVRPMPDREGRLVFAVEGAGARREHLVPKLGR